MKPEYHFAYVFERFPSFTQTFCAREVMELQRQGVRPLLFSIRDTRDEPQIAQFPNELLEQVHFLPEEKDLVEEVKALKKADKLPPEIVLTLRHWGERSDKMRVYEAAWIALKMEEHKVRHAHAHFAGIGARVCWWLRKFHGFSYSFTGHANDLFCKTGFDLTLDQLMRDASLVVTVSDYTVGHLESRFPHAKGKIHRVYNGLNLEPFLEAGALASREQAKGDPVELISVGRLIEKKGFDDLIEALGNLKSHSFRCRIIGDGPMEAELQTRIAELGLEEKVILVGPKAQPEVIAMLREAHLFVLPCVTEKDGGKDNLPTVIMEAMAAGLPTISTRLAGVPEMVEEGKTGVLVNERDVPALTKALASLMEDPGACLTYGSQAVPLAQERFSKEKTARQLLRLLISHGHVRWDAALGTQSDLAIGYVRQLPAKCLTMLPRKKVKEDQVKAMLAQSSTAS